VAQVDDEDKWQKSTLAVVGVARDRKAMDSTLSKVLNFVSEFHNINLIDHEMELI
jgi:uncharacterized protein YlxP (DUF503 family)